MEVRPRTEDDHPTLARILSRVALDGYPPHRPTAPTEFFAAGSELVAFVYEVEGRVVGHVAFHRYSARSVMAAASEGTGVPPDGLGAVARLFVDPRFRHRRIGTTLLDATVHYAREVGLRPVLDVWERLPAAIALYESAGWERVGSVEITFGSPCSVECVHEGNSIRSIVLVAPDAPNEARPR